jgi:AmmeMemoRadiSam system protein B
MKKALLISFMTAFALWVTIEGYLSHGAGRHTDGKAVRPPVVAGMFYPRSPSQLQDQVKAMLDRVPHLKPEGRILAAIAPHAGYTFSGGVAAYTHKLISLVNFDTLVIIGHDTYRNAVAFTCPVDYFQTPLGSVPVDREMMAKMHAFNGGIRPEYSLHAQDHTVEVQLPFLQVLGRQCKILPLLFGNPTPENCRLLADAILAAAGKKAVFVLASSDMSHYPPYEAARTIDNSTLEALGSLNVMELFSHLKRVETRSAFPNLQTAMCARGGVGTALLYAKARGANRAQILRYANSGDVAGAGKDRVVGYCSVLMVKGAETQTHSASPGGS